MVGAPFEFEVLGQVLLFKEFGSRVGQPASIESGAVKGNRERAACAGNLHRRARA